MAGGIALGWCTSNRMIGQTLVTVSLMLDIIRVALLLAAPRVHPRGGVPLAVGNDASSRTRLRRTWWRFGRFGLPIVTAEESPASGASALDLYDDNGNGRITCAEARRHGIAPVRRGHPAYQYMYDSDNDGVVCE